MWVVAMIAVFAVGYILELVLRLIEKLMGRR